MYSGCKEWIISTVPSLGVIVLLSTIALEWQCIGIASIIIIWIRTFEIRSHLDAHSGHPIAMQN